MKSVKYSVPLSPISTMSREHVLYAVSALRMMIDSIAVAVLGPSSVSSHRPKTCQFAVDRQDLHSPHTNEEGERPERRKTNKGKEKLGLDSPRHARA